MPLECVLHESRIDELFGANVALTSETETSIVYSIFPLVNQRRAMLKSVEWNRSIFASVGLILVISGANATAKEGESGPRVGASLSPFEVTKCGGGEDGIEVGETLCYRSRNGIRPQVIIFARVGDKLENVSDLAKQLDEWAAAEKNHRAFVAVLGDSVDSAKEAATKLAESLELKTIPVVVPNEIKNGPETYELASDQQVTALIVKRGRVRAVVQDTGDQGASALAKSVMDSVTKTLK